MSIIFKTTTFEIDFSNMFSPNIELINVVFPFPEVPVTKIRFVLKSASSSTNHLNR